MLKLKALISRTFLYSIALLPLISLFWEQEIGVLKVNWILYPLVLCSLVSTIVLRNRISKLFILLISITSFYLFKALFSSISPESIIRMFVSIVPLFFVDLLSEQHD